MWERLVDLNHARAALHAKVVYASSIYRAPASLMMTALKMQAVKMVVEI